MPKSEVIAHLSDCKQLTHDLWPLYFPENQDLNIIEFSLPDDASKEVLPFQAEWFFKM